MNAVIPFGKYKDQPLEILISDPEYTTWLLQQVWLKQRFPDIHTVIINNFKDSSEETPIHNYMQGRFLEDDYCIRFLEIVNPTLFERIAKIPDRSWHFSHAQGIKHISVRKSFENLGIDVTLSFRIIYYKTLIPCLIHEYMEMSGAEYQTYDFNIEIKPVVGDDYPAILRQMKASKSNVLFIGQYKGIGLSVENFKKYFFNERIRVIFESELMDESEYE